MVSFPAIPEWVLFAVCGSLLPVLDVLEAGG